MPVGHPVKPIAQYSIHSMGMNNMDKAALRNLLNQNIKRFRQSKGLPQAKLAEKMDISTNYLSDIETKRGMGFPFIIGKTRKRPRHWSIWTI